MSSRGGDSPSRAPSQSQRSASQGGTTKYLEYWERPIESPTPKSLGITEMDDFPSLQPLYDLSLRSQVLHVNLLMLYKIPEHVFTLEHLVSVPASETRSRRRRGSRRV